MLDSGKIIRSAGVVGLLVLISRVFGLIRDVVMAAAFGTSVSMSAFVVAFTIPNLFRGLFGEGAMSSAFIPVFTETRDKFGSDRSWVLASRMFSALSLILALIVFVGILVATGLLCFFPAGERFSLILRLLRIMFPYTFFICVAAFFSAMLNSLHIFGLPAAAPVALNVAIILTVLVVCPRLHAQNHAKISAVAWAVIAAGAVEASMLLPRLYREGFRLRVTLKLRDGEVGRIWSLMGVAFIGVGAAQVNVLLDRFIAAFISGGAPSYLYFAERLTYLPLGIFATALGTVLLPAFSDQAAAQRTDKMLETFNSSLRHLMFVMVPAAAGMMALASPIVRVAFERGDFDAFSTRMTMLALMCYAPGLAMFSMLKVLVPLFYARQDMKTPVRVGLICTGVNIALSLALMWPLKHLGIAIATVIAAAVHVVMLSVLAHRKIGSPGWGAIFLSFSRMACAAAGMSLTAVLAHRWLSECAGMSGGFARQAAALGGSILLAAFAYLACAILFRCPELGEIWLALKGDEARRS